MFLVTKLLKRSTGNVQRRTVVRGLGDRASPGVNTSVPCRVRNLRKMRNFWANFTDFEPEINRTGYL